MWMYLAACGDFEGSSSEARPVIDTMLHLAGAVSHSIGRYFSSGRVMSQCVFSWPGKQRPSPDAEVGNMWGATAELRKE